MVSFGVGTKASSYACLATLALAFWSLMMLTFWRSGPMLTCEVASSQPKTSLSDGRPLAVVIETKATANLVPLMLHFGNVLGPDWTVVLFTLQENWHAPSSPAFNRALKRGIIDVRFLPKDTEFTSSGSVSRFLAQPWLWEQVQSAHRVLLWQTDSILCSKAPQSVESFFDYDFVGAPIDAKYGQGYNGGLSLRNPKLFLEITRDSDFESSGEDFEDQWFFKEAKARTHQGVLLPSEDAAKVFSVETIYYHQPLGYHQPSRWQRHNMAQIEEWCPEVKMLIERRVT